MSIVSVAMAEIVREGTWALRALGYPYGTAERAVSLLAWTEAVQGHALTMLRVGAEAIVAGAAQPTPRWSVDPQGRNRAEVQGKCLFECGPPALDLATADARLGGLGRAVLRGAIGNRLAASLGALAAERGLAAVLVHAPDGDEITPVPPAGWICALPTPQDPAFLAGSLGDPLPAAVPAALRVAAQDIAEAIASGSGGFFSIAATPSDPLPPPPAATDWPQRLALAYQFGVETDSQDYETLYTLEERTWAPTSERSRAQAGYGHYQEGPR